MNGYMPLTKKTMVVGSMNKSILTITVHLVLWVCLMLHVTRCRMLIWNQSLLLLSISDTNVNVVVCLLNIRTPPLLNAEVTREKH